MIMSRSKLLLSRCIVAHRRSLHSRVPLPYPVEEGVADFLSPAALKTVAVDWQQGVLDRLTDLARGTTFESRSVIQTLIASAQDPSHALTFNYASEALNNSFFLSNLSTTPSPLTPNSALSLRIRSDFTSLAALISHFSSHVAGLHPSSGAYVWLVTDKNGDLGVVGTYAGGTVLVRERTQTTVQREDKVLGEALDPVVKSGASKMMALDAALESNEVPESAQESPVPAPTAASPSTSRGVPPVRRRASALMAETIPTDLLERSFSTSARQSAELVSNILNQNMPLTHTTRFTAGTHLRPLLCLSVHPHCYLQDYGVWGREEYTRRWWATIDWKKVEQSYQAMVTAEKGRS